MMTINRHEEGTPHLITTNFQFKLSLVRHLVHMRSISTRSEWYIDQDYQVDNHLLWAAVCRERDVDGKRIVNRSVACYILHKTRKGWAYRLCTESDNLVHVSCPLRLLDTTEPRSHKWRAAVRAYHSAYKNDRHAFLSFFESSKTSNNKSLFVKLLAIIFAGISFLVGLLDVILDLGLFGM